MNEPGIAAALAAGLLSFVSPCVLPLVPAYLSFITGSGAGSGSGSRPARAGRGRVFAASLAFSAGFTVAFTVLGVVFSGSALFFGQLGAGGSLVIIGGIVVVLLGLNMLFEPFAFLARDTRVVGKIAAARARKRAEAGASARRAPDATLFGAFTLGLAFAAGWSPCIGPILASILIFASRDGQVLKAAGLLVTYSLGFALPFLAAGLFFDRLKPLMDWLKRRGNQVRFASGILLVAFGVAMAMGSLGNLSAIAARAGQSLTALAARAPLAARIADLALILAAAAPAIIRLARRARHGSTAAASGHARPSTLAIAWLALCGIAFALEVSGVLPLWKIAGFWLGFAGI